MCNFPFYVKNPKTKELVRVPCNYCQGCRQDRIFMWSYRIRFEQNYFLDKFGLSSSFGTLTYNDESLPSDGSVHVRDIQLFNKRLRKKISHPYKYFIVSEYGSVEKTCRPHYHCIFLGLDFEKDLRLVNKSWNKGFIDLKLLLPGGIRYTLKYLVSESRGSQLREKYNRAGLEPPFALMSKGIGRQFLIDNKDFIIEHGGFYSQGRFVKIPKYYRDLLCLSSQSVFSDDKLFLLRSEAFKLGFDNLFDYDKYVRLSREKTLVAKARLNGSVVGDAFFNSNDDVKKLAMKIDFSIDT